MALLYKGWLIHPLFSHLTLVCITLYCYELELQCFGADGWAPVLPSTTL